MNLWIALFLIFCILFLIICIALYLKGKRARKLEESLRARAVQRAKEMNKAIDNACKEVEKVHKVAENAYKAIEEAQIASYWAKDTQIKELSIASARAEEVNEAAGNVSYWIKEARGVADDESCLNEIIL